MWSKRTREGGNTGYFAFAVHRTRSRAGSHVIPPQPKIGIETLFLAERRHDRPWDLLANPVLFLGAGKAPTLRKGAKGCLEPSGHHPQVYLACAAMTLPAGWGHHRLSWLSTPSLFKCVSQAAHFNMKGSNRKCPVHPHQQNYITSNTKKPASFLNPNFHNFEFPKKPPLGPN